MTNPSTSFRLSKAARANLKRLAKKANLSETQVLEILLREADAIKILAQWKAATPPVAT